MSAILHERFTGRSQRVVDFLVNRGAKGATMRELIVLVEPGCKPNNMAGTLATLVRANKLTTKDSATGKRYVATATAQVDGRKAANAAGKRRKRGTGPRDMRTPAEVAATRRQAERYHAVANTRGRVAKPRMRLTTMVAKSPAVLPANTVSDAQTVEQFLARGGQIERLPNGATSTHPNGFAPLPPRQARALGGDLPTFIPD